MTTCPTPSGPHAAITIRLPVPKTLRGIPVGEDESLRHNLQKIAETQFFDLRDLGNLVLTSGPKAKPENEWLTEFGVEVYDVYDRYFGVVRTTGNPIDELASAFLSALQEVGEEAERGHSLDPLAVNAFLRAVQVMAQLLMKEAYHA